MPPHPSDARNAPSRERLLQAAKRLFAAQGYEQTATSAIAREAGTSESQLMRYFGGKSGVLEALFDESWVDLKARVRRVVDAGGDSREAILRVVQAIAGALARDPDLAALLLFEGRRLRGGEPRVQSSAGLVAFAETIRTLVRRGQGAGEIDPSLESHAVTASITGAAEALIRDRILARAAGARTYGEREIRRTLEALLSGLAPSRPPPGRAAGSTRARRRK